MSGNSNSVQTLAINGTSSLVRDTDTLESDDDIFASVVNFACHTCARTTSRFVWSKLGSEIAGSTFLLQKQLSVW